MSRINDRETLSAMLDGEAGDLEVRRLLRDLDDEALARWARWQAARDLMHGQEVNRVPADFTSRLRASLEEEGRSGIPGHSVMKHFARAGVAASVAIAVVFGWQYLDDGTGPGLSEEVVQVDLSEGGAGSAARETAPLLGEAATVSSSRGSGEEAGIAGYADERVNQMMLRHSESAARHGGQGMVPYVRLINLDALQEDR